jgi:MoaA/NifB/PqqE/SkfB family radical SAM enzyme
MARIVIELTNRCNLRCLHCYDERHAATGELPLALLEQVLGEGRSCAIDHFCFTGGRRACIANTMRSSAGGARPNTPGAWSAMA